MISERGVGIFGILFYKWNVIENYDCLLKLIYWLKEKKNVEILI